MKRGKAQYSLEFLVTYGWALLIIGIVLGAIYTFGWIDASNFLPQRCTFYGQTGCKDFYLSETEFNLSVINNYGVKLNITSADFLIDSTVVCSGVEQNREWNRSDFQYVTFDLSSLEGCNQSVVTDLIRPSSRVSATAIIEFYSPETCPGGSSDCRHNTTGVIITKVQ